METGNFASTCLIPTFWVDLKLIEITPYNHDTSIFSFSLPRASQLTRNGENLSPTDRENNGESFDSPYEPVILAKNNDDTLEDNIGTDIDLSVGTEELDKAGDYLLLPTCACLLAMAPASDHNGQDAVRPYTPISSSKQKGSFQLLIKRYDEWGQKCEPGTIFASFAYNLNPHSYKPKGAMSNYLFSKKVGDTVKVMILQSQKSILIK